MKIDYKVTDGKLFDLDGNEVLPDEKGIVYLTVEGHPRKFVLEQFIIWITKAKQIQPVEKRPVGRPLEKPRMPGVEVNKNGRPIIKKGRGRPKSTSIKEKKGRSNAHRYVPVIAIHPDGKKEQFESQIDAVRKLNLGRCCIWRVMDHPTHKAKGFQFRSVTEQQKTA